MFDTWTSKSFDPYLAIMAHYIDSFPDSQITWVMKKDLNTFSPIISNHSGKNQACFIMKCIKQFGLEGKVSLYIQLGWATSDNVSNNNTTMKCLREQLISVDLQTGKQN